jgi:hypothetical protein
MSGAGTRKQALVAAALALACASSAPSADPYVFAWPFARVPMEPRGGTTRGAEVTLATGPSEAWQRLQEPGLSGAARDRAAIRAMAGDYRTSFDFLEIVLFTPGAEPARPYRSWGTERIYVVEEREDFVRLQHVLEMFAIDEEGELQGPFVQKHWRQDWQYEPENLLEFAGDGRFETRPVSPEERRGIWSQTVHEVDDSPRYASLGRWEHGPRASTWQGGEAWRPLPRREHSVRDDYSVLAGRNRLTVLPEGWVHEQDNQKLQTADGAALPLAREIGVNRYERIRDFDFGAADAYWAATRDFWARVREAWAERAAPSRVFRVRADCNGEPSFVPFFRLAARLQAGEAVSAEAQRAEIDRVLDCLVSAG